MGRRLEEDIRAEGHRQVARLWGLVVPEGDITERIVMAATEKRASLKFYGGNYSVTRTPKRQGPQEFTVAIGVLILC